MMNSSDRCRVDVKIGCLSRLLKENLKENSTVMVPVAITSSAFYAGVQVV